MSFESTYKSMVAFTGQSINTCLSFIKIILRSRPGLKMPAAQQEKCFILGNGPSLKDSLEKHSALLQGKPLMCVNSFSVSDAYTVLRPSYYVLLDPFFWEGETPVIRETLRCIEERTSWPMHLMLPVRAIRSGKFSAMISRNPHIQLIPFNYTVFKGFAGPAHFFYRKNLAMPQSNNVLVASVFLAVNMGYREVVFMGGDHSWHENLHVNEQNVLCIKDSHFYDSGEVISYKPFLKGADPKDTHKMYEIFSIWAKVFNAYFQLKAYAEKRGCRIYNASEISFIDAFERRKL